MLRNYCKFILFFDKQHNIAETRKPNSCLVQYVSLFISERSNRWDEDPTTLLRLDVYISCGGKVCTKSNLMQDCHRVLQFCSCIVMFFLSCDNDLSFILFTFWTVHDEIKRRLHSGKTWYYLV